MLTNREIATLTLFGVAALYLLLSPTGRSSLLGIVRAFHWKIQLAICTYLSYSSFLVWIAWRLGIWDSKLLKDTVIWILFAGIPLLFRASDVRDGKVLVRRVALETFAFSTFIAFYLNLHSFSIPGEIVLQLGIIMLTGMEVVATHRGDNNTKQVLHIIRFLIAAVGLFVIWRTGAWLVENWTSLDREELLMSAGMVLWLPLGLVPLIYSLAVVMHWETVLKMLPFFNQHQQVRRPVRLGFILGTRFSARYAGNFTGKWRGELAQAQTFRESLRIMADYRQALRNGSKS